MFPAAGEAVEHQADGEVQAVVGLFGSVMIPQGLALMTVVFPPQQLRKALTPVGPIMGVATVAGPILAGWLLHLDLFGSQWRSIFLINIPFGIAAAALGWRVLPHRGGEDKTARLDLIGVGLLTAASALLITPLIQGRELGWPAWTYVIMARLGSPWANTGGPAAEAGHSAPPLPSPLPSSLSSQASAAR